MASVTPTLNAVSATIGAARTPMKTICRKIGDFEKLSGKRSDQNPVKQTQIKLKIIFHKQPSNVHNDKV